MARRRRMARFTGPMSSFSKDSSVLTQKIKPGTVGRTLAFAAPYKRQLLLFLLVVVVNSSIGICNPLIYREIINVGILNGDSRLVVELAILVGCLGVFDALLGLSQTYLATRI